MTDKTIRIYPVEGAYVLHVPAIEQEVSEVEAKRLLAYDPPAFTTEPPDKAAKPSTESKET